MRIDPFKIQDYVEIKLANGVGLEHWGLPIGVIPILQVMEGSGTFWTLRDGDKILIIGGYHIFLDGVCEASLFPSEDFVRRPLSSYKIIRQYIAEWKTKFRRIQLNCRAEHKFVRFAMSLGFQFEGTLRKFGYQGHDHAMMAIVR